MFYRLPRLAIVVALACSLGLHWGLFQSVAWVGMVIQYSQEAPFKTALLRTFDGNHPCHLCKAVTKGRQAEKRTDFQTLIKKIEFSYSPAAFVFSAPTDFREVRVPETSFEQLHQVPPSPPPRSFPG